MRTRIYLLPVLILATLLVSCKKEATDHPNEGPDRPRQGIIFEETVEGPAPFSTAHSIERGDWDYAQNYVSSPAIGQKSVRFEIREDQELVKDGKRSEICIVKGADGEIERETWYSYSVYFPSDYDYDDEPEIINQWYQDGSPATALRTRRDKIILESGNDPDERVDYEIAPIVKNKWHEIVFHFIHSFQADGLIEVWYNGQKVRTINGGNMYDNVLPKFKIGLYKSAFKYGTSLVDKRVIYFDNVRVGNASARFEDMTSLK